MKEKVLKCPIKLKLSESVVIFMHQILFTTFFLPWLLFRESLSWIHKLRNEKKRKIFIKRTFKFSKLSFADNILIVLFLEFILVVLNLKRTLCYYICLIGLCFLINTFVTNFFFEMSLTQVLTRNAQIKNGCIFFNDLRIKLSRKCKQ